jgi:LuxR family transcriptional regulator, quorum-sensing system regulator SolR
MTLKVLCDAYDAMERAQGPKELRVEMQKFARQMGFEHYTYALVVNTPALKPQQYIINGFPQKWLERYLAKGYFKVDPVIGHAERSTLPAIWSDEIFHDGKSEEFWAEAYAYGLQAGLTFAVHEQSGLTGIFSLARDQALELKTTDLAALVGRAQMFASLLHQAVTRIAVPSMLPEQAGSLTARERECIKWAAEGKTAWEIGQILNITERTAVFHLNNVTQKLGAANKTQAIVRAVALKLL